MRRSTAVIAPDDTTTIRTALLYRRVSGEEQARAGQSLDAQKSRTLRYAARKGWAIGGQFEDVLSGTRDDRPGYQALLAETRRLRAENRPVAVVVSWLDRFGRSVFERARCAEELRGLGVAVHSVMERGEVPELVANILAAVAQEEVRRLVERQMEVRRYVEAKGWQFPTRAAWGYMRRPATREERRQGAPHSVLVVDPERAPYVREAFDRVANGASLYATGRWLQALPDDIRRGHAYTSATIRRLFSAPVYISRLQTGDPDILKRPVMRWEPLIDEDTWTRVQKHVAERGRLGCRPPQPCLLTPLVRCGKCGGQMRGQHQPQGLSPYSCCERFRGALAPNPGCAETVLQDPVNALVLAEALSVLDAVQIPSHLDAALRDRWRRVVLGGDHETVEAARRALDERAVHVRQEWTETALFLVDGVVEAEDYARRRDALRDELLWIEAELDRLLGGVPHSELANLEELRTRTRGWSATLRGTDLTAKQAVLALLMERVVPGHATPRRYRVDITWTTLGAALLRWRQEIGVMQVCPDPEVVFRSTTSESGAIEITAGRRRLRGDTERLRLLPPAAFNDLSARGREILCFYHGLLGEAWHTQEELMERYGLTRSQILRVLREGLVQLLGPEAAAVRHRDEPRRNGRHHELELRALPPEAYATLDDTGQQIVRLYYGLNGRRYRQAEIAEQLGTSVWHVQRSLERSLVRLLGPEATVEEPAGANRRVKCEQ